MKILALATSLTLALLSTACSTAGTPSDTANRTPAATARWTFDGNIKNNSLAISPDERLAVVSYSERPDVVIYDLTSGKVRVVLNDFVTPRNIVFAPGGQRFYVSDSSLGTVSIIETATFKTVGSLPTGAGTFGTTLSQDGGTLYINNQAASTVTAYDPAAQQPRAVVTGFAQPRQGVRLSPDGKTLYVTNFLGDKISIVDTATHKITGEIKGFDKLRAISVTADGKTIFAANSGSNSVAIVDVVQRAITAKVPVGKDPYGAALTPDGQFVYVGNLADNTVSVISVASRQVVVTISGFKEPRQAIVFTRDGKWAYVLNEDLSVAKVDRSSQRVVGTIAAPARPI
ncbi:beta-propeller fold lactonase family protein [Schauerella aestuarii]|uniref:beta-propeller fold lactonase family protein n=1 Tax=Schauerella aestuarii TaxID=2511204 RepID=UPI001367C7A5|nr:beta-propeller fold lactonase family protein [Achromobacter aestuarii]MYZ42513.1 phosphate ABC transporter substrate-binding protein [Achromobacter aestuarii]